ncbi:putative tRNA-guanine transglycosylase [Trichinella nativa]|uniref:Putative tRNA-guanine transglycosylase n=1 Tax=Trichinella nativa TaxID=6335 RepID=A0A1Y3EHH2_9BILA|nr:putative tRNA-guanine transglycosylase [Trichinella nativa]
MSGNLKFEVIARCHVTKARAGVLNFPKAVVETPVFMPVGTQGTLKGILTEQLKDLGYNLLLSNTYHLGHRPDSGGFQMVSLSKLMNISEEGVHFISPHTKEEMLLSPERSIEIQNSLGADIIMQLDDVVPSLTVGPRVEEAMYRYTFKCLFVGLIDALLLTADQMSKIFFQSFKEALIQQICQRDCPGYAVGGLSGGEDKNQFWRMVSISGDNLPDCKPRYLMGVGFAVDLLVCVALGMDMFDCRFGRALIPGGSLNLKKAKYSTDFKSIQEGCDCYTCKTFTRSYLCCVAVHETIDYANERDSSKYYGTKIRYICQRYSKTALPERRLP